MFELTIKISKAFLGSALSLVKGWLDRPILRLELVNRRNFREVPSEFLMRIGNISNANTSIWCSGIELSCGESRENLSEIRMQKLASLERLEGQQFRPFLGGGVVSSLAYGSNMFRGGMFGPDWSDVHSVQIEPGVTILIKLTFRVTPKLSQITEKHKEIKARISFKDNSSGDHSIEFHCASKNK